MLTSFDVISDDNVVIAWIFPFAPWHSMYNLNDITSTITFIQILISTEIPDFVDK